MGNVSLFRITIQATLQTLDMFLAYTRRFFVNAYIAASFFVSRSSLSSLWFSIKDLPLTENLGKVDLARFTCGFSAGSNGTA